MMKLFALAVALALAALSVQAQDQPFPRNPNIDISYVRPTDSNFALVYDRMRQLEVLETLQEFLSPLKLPRKIVVKMDQCGGALTVPYKSNGVVTICYEQLASIRNTAPQDGFVSFGQGRQLTADQAVAGGVARLILYETSFAVFDVLRIPVWGRVEEAADNVTALIMLEFGEELAWTTILGSAWYLAQRGLLGTGFFSDAARPLEAQRFYNYLCFAYGAQAKSYEFLVNGFNLPPERAKLCREEYFKLRRAFRTTFLRHIDAKLIEQVKRRKSWLPL
jgi:Putative metallopeptidase